MKTHSPDALWKVECPTGPEALSAVEVLGQPETRPCIDIIDLSRVYSLQRLGKATFRGTILWHGGTLDPINAVFEGRDKRDPGDIDGKLYDNLELGRHRLITPYPLERVEVLMQTTGAVPLYVIGESTVPLLYASPEAQ